LRIEMAFTQPDIVGRPAELGDPDWQGWRGTDTAIAVELGVSRKVVRLARHRVGVQPRPPGRPRADGTIRSGPPRASMVIADRIERESQRDGPPATYDLLLTRFVAVDRMRKAGATRAERDALIALAAAAGLLADRTQSLLST
jgi:hypothetical protein